MARAFVGDLRQQYDAVMAEPSNRPRAALLSLTKRLRDKLPNGLGADSFRRLSP
jgi:hypothetical protein